MSTWSDTEGEARRPVLVSAAAIFNRYGRKDVKLVGEPPVLDRRGGRADRLGGGG